MKTTDQIYGEMKEIYEESTGLALIDGGDMALRLYAGAAELYSLWVQADFVNRQAFPQTAEGEYLDRHAQVRGLSRGSAVKARGIIRFSLKSALTSALTVPAGTACMTAGEAEFVTTADAVIDAGSLYCDAPALASAGGEAGNVPAGSVTIMVLAPGGVYSCQNIAAFSGGADPESDDELRERVLKSYRKLPNGANAAYYETKALDTDGVAAVSVLPKNRGTGTVDVIIAGPDGVPPAELVSAVAAKLNAEREICVDLTVAAPATVSVDVTAAISAGAGYDYTVVAAAVTAALDRYFSGELLGKSVLRAKLGSVIYGVEGVENYTLTAPAADVAISAGQLPVKGTVTVTNGRA